MVRDRKSEFVLGDIWGQLGTFIVFLPPFVSGWWAACGDLFPRDGLTGDRLLGYCTGASAGRQRFLEVDAKPVRQEGLRMISGRAKPDG